MFPKVAPADAAFFDPSAPEGLRNPDPADRVPVPDVRAVPPRAVRTALVNGVPRAIDRHTVVEQALSGAPVHVFRADRPPASPLPRLLVLDASLVAHGCGRLGLTGTAAQSKIPICSFAASEIRSLSHGGSPDQIDADVGDSLDPLEPNSLHQAGATTTRKPGGRAGQGSPRAGGHLRDAYRGREASTRLAKFQPTPPARGATFRMRTRRGAGPGFNPRPPRGGRLAAGGPVQLRLCLFQPTPSARGATRSTAACSRRDVFQPTPPARGATRSAGTVAVLFCVSSVTGYSGRFRPCHRGEMERTFGKLRHDAVAPAQFCRSGGTGFLPVWRGGARCSGRAFSPGRRRGVLVGAAAKSGCGVGPGGCGRPGVEMAESEPGGAVPRVSVRGRGPRGVRAARMRGPAPPAVRRAAAGRGLRGRRVRGRAASW